MGSENEWVPTPQSFKRRKNEVEAVKVTEDNADQVADWCGGRVHKTDFANSSFSAVFRPQPQPQLLIPTLDGAVEVFKDEWVVHLENGQYECMTEHNFKKLFEYVSGH